MKNIRKVVIPVAGHGTRSLPASKNVPKEMLPIYNKPVIHYVVDEAVNAGIENVVFITSKEKTALEDISTAITRSKMFWNVPEKKNC